MSDSSQQGDCQTPCYDTGPYSILCTSLQQWSTQKFRQFWEQEFRPNPKHLGPIFPVASGERGPPLRLVHGMEDPASDEEGLHVEIPSASDGNDSDAASGEVSLTDSHRDATPHAEGRPIVSAEGAARFRKAWQRASLLVPLELQYRARETCNRSVSSRLGHRRKRCDRLPWPEFRASILDELENEHASLYLFSPVMRMFASMTVLLLVKPLLYMGCNWPAMRCAARPGELVCV